MDRTKLKLSRRGSACLNENSSAKKLGNHWRMVSNRKYEFLNFFQHCWRNFKISWHCRLFIGFRLSHREFWRPGFFSSEELGNYVGKILFQQVSIKTEKKGIKKKKTNEHDLINLSLKQKKKKKKKKKNKKKRER